MSKIQNSELLKWSKWSFLGLKNRPNWISRKIRVARKLLNFHTTVFDILREITLYKQQLNSRNFVQELDFLNVEPIKKEMWQTKLKPSKFSAIRAFRASEKLEFRALFKFEARYLVIGAKELTKWSPNLKFTFKFLILFVRLLEDISTI